jgi:hypothetical protein
MVQGIANLRPPPAAADPQQNADELHKDLGLAERLDEMILPSRPLRPDTNHFLVAKRQVRVTMSMPWAAVLLLIAGGLTACGLASPPKPKQYSWTEEVKLDARVIRVRRVVEVKETNSWSGDAYNAVETFSRIEFTGDLASLPPWNQALRPILIYQDPATSEWVVVASTSSCEVWRSAGKPKPPYWEDRLKGHVWVPVSLSEASHGRPANLAQKFKRMAEAGYLTAEERAKLDFAPNRFRTFRKVDAVAGNGFCGEY